MKKSMFLIATGLASGMFMMGTNFVTRQPTVNIVRAESINDVGSDGIAFGVKSQLFLGAEKFATPEFIEGLPSFDYNADINSPLEDISGLNYGTKMTSINLQNSGVKDISPISNLTQLKELNLNATPYVKTATNLDDLKLLTNLTSLDLGGGDPSNGRGTISDISALKNMSKLTSLKLSNADITNIDDLSGLTSLSDLDLSNNPTNTTIDIPGLTDISGISNLKNLKTLNLSGDTGINIDDINALESNKSLTNVTLPNYPNPLSINMEDLYADNDSESIDISKYIHKDATVTPVITVDSSGDSAKPTAVYDPDSQTIKVDRITEDKLSVEIKEFMTINGHDYPLMIKLTQQIMLKSMLPKLNTTDVSVVQGQTWDPSSGLTGEMVNGQLYSIDKTTIDAAISNGELTITGDKVDTNKPGTYKVTYNLTGVPSSTITVTVTPKVSSSSNSGSNSSSSSNNSKISDINKLSLITKKSDSIPVYDQNGKKVSDKALSKITTFNTTQKNIIDGTTYYEISNSEWIKADDVREYTKESGVLQTKSDSDKLILNLNGVRLNRALKHTTDWLYDGYAEFNGTKYYRVATDEWVKADDVILIKGVKGVVKANTQATLYKDTGDQSNRALAKNSTFVTDKISKTIDNETMYRVATDEWVKASDVTFTQK
ncbi:SLAP domain-containing protein [Companilactobacillus nodensis]|nr:SLAP domain-containing protein [Companilactobacillus nodensis]